jgi:hypothetical protein
MMTRRTLLHARLRASLCLLSSSLAALTLLTGCSGGSDGSGGGGSSRAPAPIVANVSPTTIPAGSAAFTLAVTGSNFQSQAVVNWNSTALATTYNSATSLSAAVPANLAATGVLANIIVANPDGQATSSSGVSSQVSVTNPAPTLTTVSPLALYAGSSDTSFTLTGTNFNASSIAMAGATALTTTLVSSTQLTAVVPAATLAPVGTLSLSVSNPTPGGGTSQSVSVTLRQPAAKLTSISPASVTAGSSPVTVTITGSYFTPTAVVYLSGFQPAPITYVSSTSIQFTVSAQYLSSARSFSIIVRDQASQNITSNALTFSIVNPVPVLNSISPGSVTAGAPNFTLTLTGTNFVQSATIQINGTTVQPTLYPTATTATVIVPASAVSSLGDVSVTITNPTPGGGTSAAQTLHVISASNRIRTVNLQAIDLGWDSAHNLLVAASGSTITNTPNNLVTIDPLQGTIVTTQPLPSSPAGISVTDDGSYVYVTLPSTGQVERFTLPSLTPDITFSLGNDPNGHAYISPTIAAAPGHPHTVAVPLYVGDTIPMDATGGVAVYDDGVVRSNIAAPSGIYNYYETVVWGSDATVLYGTNSGVGSGDEDTFAVNANGVALVSDQQSVIGEFVRHLTFDTKTGHLIDGYGNVVNAATDQYLGQMLVQNTLIYEENLFALDTIQRKAFYLNANGFYPDSPPGEYIESFNADQYSYINSMLVEGLTGGSSIIRWGASGLAINGSQIYLIDGSFVSPSGVSSAVGGYIAPSPTLTSVNPAAVAAGSPDTQVTLTGRDFTQASQVTWNNQALLINSVSDTQIVVTISASMLTNPEASAITVTNGPGTAPSGTLGFSVLPNLGANTQINVLDLSGEDLAWDSTRNLLYVAVPNSDTVYPNTIAVIDPTKPAIQQTVPAADQPSALSLSDDDQYLYAGYWGQPIVQRFSLPSFSLDLTIPAGTATGVAEGRMSCTYAADVKAAPGNPQTIAVTYGNINVGPRDCGTVAIFDNATPRPVTALAGRDDFGSLAWTADASTIYTQIGGLSSLSVSPSGVTLSGTFNTGSNSLDPRVHFDSGTSLLYSDSGVITNPVTSAQAGKLSAGGLLVTDDALKRIFVLTNTNGINGSSYTLEIFDLNTQALLNSISIPDVLGYPNQMARWGTNGIVFVTSSNNLTSAPGVLYILQGSGISGTP